MDIKNDKITYPTSEDIYTQTILEQMTNVFTGYLSKNINNFVIKVQQKKKDNNNDDDELGSKKDKSLLVLRSTIPNYHIEVIPALIQVLTSITNYNKEVLCLIKKLDMSKINALRRHLNTLVYEASRYRHRYIRYSNSSTSGDPYLDSNINALKHILELLDQPIVLKVATIKTQHKVDFRSDFIIESNNNNDDDGSNGGEYTSSNNSISSGIWDINNTNNNNNSNNIVTLIPNALYSIAIMIMVESNNNNNKKKEDLKHIIENTQFFVYKEININNKELEKNVDKFISKGKFPFKPILSKRRYPLLIDTRWLISLYRAMLLSMTNTLSVEFIDKNGSSLFNIDREYTFMNYL